MPDPATIDDRTEAEIALTFPIEYDGLAISTITVRRPKLRDQFKMSRGRGDDIEKGLAMMADLTNMPVEQLLELDQVDAEKIRAQIEAFTGRVMPPDGDG